MDLARTWPSPHMAPPPPWEQEDLAHAGTQKDAGADGPGALRSLRLGWLPGQQLGPEQGSASGQANRQTAAVPWPSLLGI